MQDEKYTTTAKKAKATRIHFVLSKWIKTGYYNGQRFYALVVMWPTGNIQCIAQGYKLDLIYKQDRKYLLIKK